MNLEELFFEAVPRAVIHRVEDARGRRTAVLDGVVERFKQGRKTTVSKKVFPGYLLVRCHMDDQAWFCIRNTPGVTGFVGQAHKNQKPTPLSRREVQTFLSAKGDGEAAPKRKAPKMEYEVGESVRVKEGPFADFNGTVAEINADDGSLTAEMGRYAPQKAEDLKTRVFDRVALGARGFGYERLDQLTVDVLLGVRQVLDHHGDVRIERVEL